MDTFNGLRVVDFSTMVAVPMATSMLAECGADVVKVETLQGDGIRRYGPVCENMSSLFLFLNRGKRSLAIDIKTPQGRECVMRLVVDADVVVHQFRPGVAERLGIGYDDVSRLNPSVLYAEMTGFGEKGPWRNARAYDPILQAYTGLSRQQGGDGHPHGVVTPIPDKMSGVIVANVILVGLAERARTGKGSLIQSSMLQAMLWWLWSDMIGQRAFVLFDDVPMNRHNPSTEAVFETSDGRYIAAWAMSDADWGALATAMGRDDWIDDPDFGKAENRNARIAEMVELIRSEVVKHAYEPLTARLRDADAVWAPANDPEALLHDEQVVANEMFVEFDHGLQGRVRQPPLPFRIDRTHVRVLPTPQLGEHTEEILREVGYPDAVIESLVSDQVVKCARR